MKLIKPIRPGPVQRARFLIANKSRAYWLAAALIVAVSVVLTPYAEQAVGLRYTFFHILTAIDPRKPQPNRTAIVFIDELTYRKMARIPLPRDHLTAVLKALDDNSIELVALDFNLMAADYSAPLQVGNFGPVGSGYRHETDEFVREIISFAEHHQIVLGKMLWATGPESDQTIRSLLDAYQPYGICVKPLANGAWTNPGTASFYISPAAATHIRCGYLNAPKDMRQLPTPLPVGNGFPIDSFSMAIVRAVDPGALANIKDGTIFSGYFRERAILDQKTFTTSQLIDPRQRGVIWNDLGHRIVIVGGHWKTGPGDNDFVDMSETPLGSVSGTIIHQNYVEAVLDHRLYNSFGGSILEVLFAAAAAFVFAAYPNLWVKFGLLSAGVAGLLLFQWLVFYLFYFFFDASLPVIGLGVHSIAERLLEPRHEAEVVP